MCYQMNLKEMIVTLDGLAATESNTLEAVSKSVKRGRGRPGGDGSRARILSSAGKFFASRGYNGVSMRELAQAAKANLGAISYHFGGKRKHYHETSPQLIEDIGSVFGPIVRRLREEVTFADGKRARKEHRHEIRL